MKTATRPQHPLADMSRSASAAQLRQSARIPLLPEQAQEQVAAAAAQADNARLQAIEQAEAALANCTHLAGKQLRVEGSHSRITLCGEVNSYFHKQLAQEAIMRLEGITTVDNQLHVRPREHSTSAAQSAAKF